MWGVPGRFDHVCRYIYIVSQRDFHEVCSVCDVPLATKLRYSLPYRYRLSLSSDSSDPIPAVGSESTCTVLVAMNIREPLNPTVNERQDSSENSAAVRFTRVWVR
eukprot:COSAG02_NODE_25899_length_646_cov_0.839122_1_plen_105_part_00